MNGIKMGVALTKCFYCHEDNEIVINTRLNKYMANKVESLNGMVINMHPCNKCEGYMKQGIILMGINEQKCKEGWNKPPQKYTGSSTDNWMPNPYRSGAFAVIKEEAALRLFPEDYHVCMVEKRWVFVDHEVLVRWGIVQKATTATDCHEEPV